MDEEEKDLEELSEVDRNLYESVTRNDTVGARHALRSGANVNCVCNEDYDTPLAKACERGYDHIVRILLDAGADPWWRDLRSLLPIKVACVHGHMSIVEMLLNHDDDLLEIANEDGKTPLLTAIEYRQFFIAHFLLDRGANALVTDENWSTTLMLAFRNGANLLTVRRLLAAGVAVESRDRRLRTALHFATIRGNTALLRELIVEHNSNMFALDENGETPFDLVTDSKSAAGRVHALLMESYSNKLTQEHGRLALHAVLGAAECSFAEAYRFHPPQNPIQIHLPLGKLTLQHFRTLLSTLDPELIRDRDATGKLPIHIACQNKAPVDVLDLILKQDAATLHITDYTGALPINVCCHGAVDYSSVLFLVEHGGVSTLAACNHHGALPLHLLCESTNPSLRTVQYLIQSFRGSVAARTNAGHYPFMIAACESSTASLSVVYELDRTNPDLVVPY